MSQIPPSEIVEITLFTLQITLTATFFGALLGVPIGAAIGLRARPAPSLFRVLLYTLYALPPVIAGLVGYLVLSRAGPLGALRLLFTPTAIVIVETLLAAPLIAGLTLAALAEVPRAVRDTVRGSGAPPWLAQWTLLKEARVGIVSAIMVGMGRTLAEVAGALIVGGNIRHETRTLGTAILQEVGQGDFDAALALGGILLALAFASVLVLAYLQSRPGARSE